MKYCRRVNDNRFFQRDWPTNLRETFGSRKQFSQSLGSADQTEAQLLTARDEALSVFDERVRLARVSDVTTLTVVEIDHMSDLLLASRGSKAGAFAHPDEDDDVRLFKPKEKTLDAMNLFQAAEALPEMLVVANKENMEEKLTTHDLAIGEAWMKAVSKPKPRLRRLSDIWTGFSNHKGYNDGGSQYKTWQQFMRVMGDCLISKVGIEGKIREAINAYRDLRLQMVSISTVKRDFSDILSCLNYSSADMSLG